MPKSKSPKGQRKNSPAVPDSPVSAGLPAEALDEFENFAEPVWLTDVPAESEELDLEAPAWLEASSSTESLSKPEVVEVEAEEPADPLFLATEAMADLATMDNAVRRADFDIPVIEPAAALVFDEFPDEPEWATADASNAVAEAVPEPDAAAAQRADAALQSIVEEIDAQIVRSSPNGILDDSFPGLEPRPETATAQHVVFYLGQSRYSLPIEAVTEVSTVPRITILPGIPHYVRGVANLRGEILPVLDMRGLLGLPRISNAVLERMLVVRFAEQDAVVGFVVDRVRGLARLDQDRITHPHGLAEDAVLRFLEGVTEHENEVLNVLNTRKIFLSEEVRRLSGI